MKYNKEQCVGLNESIIVDVNKKPDYYVNFDISSGLAINISDAFNIDVEAEVMNAMISEVNYTLSKNALNKMFSTDTQTYTEFDDLVDIHKICCVKKNKPVAIITNGHVGTHLQDQPFYTNEMFSDEKTKNITNGLPYLVGEFNDVKHFVDPNMRWDDDRICLLFNNFYNFKLYVSDDSVLAFVKQVKPKVKLFKLLGNRYVL